MEISEHSGISSARRLGSLFKGKEEGRKGGREPLFSCIQYLQSQEVAVIFQSSGLSSWLPPLGGKVAGMLLWDRLAGPGPSIGADGENSPRNAGRGKARTVWAQELVMFGCSLRFQKRVKAVAISSGQQTAGDQLPHTEKLQSKTMRNNRLSHEEVTIY